MAVKKKRRQNRFVTHLLSNTLAFLRYTPGLNEKLVENLEDFIGDINLWFNVFNKYMVKITVPFKNVYGTVLDKKEHVNTVFEMIANTTTIGKMHYRSSRKG